jgi:YD repeat-containing protein
LGRTSDTKWTNSSGTTVFDWFSYGYDANSNMLYRKNNLDAAMSELYQENNADPSDAYDGLDRLVAFSRGTLSSDNRSTTNPSRTQVWNLDGQDNWASVTTNSTTQDLDHNAANEITSTGFAYDAAGNLTSDGTYTFTYDGWNRLVKVETVGGTPETVATYAYDGQNHRISKTAGGVTTEYYYDAAWRVVEERQNGQTTATYVYGLQTPDVPIARIAGGQTRRQPAADRGVALAGGKYLSPVPPPRSAGRQKQGADHGVEL